jgi:hypothetical protein
MASPRRRCALPALRAPDAGGRCRPQVRYPACEAATRQEAIRCTGLANSARENERLPAPRAARRDDVIERLPRNNRGLCRAVWNTGVGARHCAGAHAVLGNRHRRELAAPMRARSRNRCLRKDRTATDLQFLGCRDCLGAEPRCHRRQRHKRSGPCRQFCLHGVGAAASRCRRQFCPRGTLGPSRHITHAAAALVGT